MYLKAFHKLSGFRFQSRLSTWIAKIAYNSCLSWLEKKQLVLPGSLDESYETGVANADTRQKRQPEHYHKMVLHPHRAGHGAVPRRPFSTLGIHSLAIMSPSLAASFLGYYFFTGRADKTA